MPRRRLDAMPARYWPSTVLYASGYDYRTVGELLGLSEKSAGVYVDDAKRWLDGELTINPTLSREYGWRQAIRSYIRENFREVADKLRERDSVSEEVWKCLEVLYAQEGQVSLVSAIEQYERQYPSLLQIAESGLYGPLLSLTEDLHESLIAFGDDREIRSPLFLVKGLRLLGLANTGRLPEAHSVANERLGLAEELGELEQCVVVRDKGALAYAGGHYKDATEALMAAQLIELPLSDEETSRIKGRLASEIACSIARYDTSSPDVEHQLEIMASYPSSEHLYTEIEVGLLRRDVRGVRELTESEKTPSRLDLSSEALLSLSSAILGWYERDLELVSNNLQRAEYSAQHAGLDVLQPALTHLRTWYELVQTGKRRFQDFDPATNIVLFTLHPL